MRHFTAELVLLCVLLTVLLSGCGGREKTLTPAVTEVPAETGTETLSGTPTGTPAPSLTPTSSLTPTPTPVPDPIGSPTPTPDYTGVLAAYEETLETVSEKMEELAKKKDLPIISVTTEDGRIISEKNYTVSVVDLYNCGEEFALSGLTAEIKVRGNSTADSAPYPYRIRFQDKQNLLGLHEGEKYRSWVLLKPTWNLCPDYVAHRVARVLYEGRYYVSDGCFVNVVMNGQELGVYYLCEQNQAASGRIDVNEPGEGDTGVLTGYVLELDNYTSDEHPYFYMDFDGVTITDWQGETRTANSHGYSILSDTRSGAQREFIENYFRGVWEIVYRGCEKGEAWGFDSEWNLTELLDTSAYEAVTAVVDVCSFYNMIILEELCQNYDVGAGSMYFCVDFGEDSLYPKLTVLSPWDFNWGYGEDAFSGFYATTWQKLWTDNWDRSNIWFITLMKADWFREGLFGRWKKVSESGALSEMLDDASSYIETLRNDEGENSWRVDCGQEVIRYVRNRIRYLDSHFTDEE